MGVLDNIDSGYDDVLHAEAYEYACERVQGISRLSSDELKPYVYFEVVRQLGEAMLRDRGVNFTREFWKDCFREAAVNGDWK